MHERNVAKEEEVYNHYEHHNHQQSAYTQHPNPLFDRSHRNYRDSGPAQAKVKSVLKCPTIYEPEPVVTKEPKKQDAFAGKLLAIEALCPNCSSDCANTNTGSVMIPEDLIGYTVTCIECHTESLVP